MKKICKVIILYVCLTLLLTLKIYARYACTYTINAYKLTLDTDNKNDNIKMVGNTGKSNSDTEKPVEKEKLERDNEASEKENIEKSEGEKPIYNVQKRSGNDEKKKDTVNTFVIIKK